MRVVVLVTDLTEEEETLALATFDPLAGLARADTEARLARLRLAQDAPVVEADENPRDLLRLVAKGHVLQLEYGERAA